MSPARSASPAALSDGEVLSGDEEKAISTHTSRDRDSRVNNSTRHQKNGSSSRASQHYQAPLEGLRKDRDYHFGDDRERSRSPYRRDRSRSPYRAGKAPSGEKRRREDDHYSAKGGSDLRRFKVHYEERPGSRDGTGNRSNRAYGDLDRPEPPRTLFSYGERSGRGRGRDERDRSRSPYRHGKADARPERREAVSVEDRLHSRPTGSEHAREQRRGSTHSVTARESAPQAPLAKDDAKIKISLSQQQQRQAPDDKADTDASTADPSQSSAEQPKLSEAEIIEQRRKRREAIKAKHKSQPGLLVQALEHSAPSAPATPAHDSSGAVSEQQSPPSSTQSPRTPMQNSPPESPAAFIVNDDEELANRNHADVSVNDDDGPSAADYDPNFDLQEDRPDHKRSGVEAPLLNVAHDSAPEAETTAAPKAGKEFDMFADDEDDDMFAATDTTAKPAASTTQAKTLDQSLLDNWDYPDGHYRIILGELLNGRYAVQQQIGKGTFATVVKAQDTQTGQPVAIKIAANNETMYKAGQKELDFLQLLNQNDPEDKKHIIRMLRNFDHKGHLCLVFEALSADLREVLKKFGRNVGLNLKAIRSYAQQMFLALSHMKKCNILHADLKPDNILVSEKRSLLKICDLGTASFADDAEVTPYLVSRFYRAPEVILGVPFDYAIDMWAIGCTLFELYTGRILFAGADNNAMLRAIQECRGKFPIRMLKRSTLADKHFDADGTFYAQERDKITGTTVLRPVHFKQEGVKGKDLRSRLAGNAKGLAPEGVREHASFVDLMEKCLQVDPGRRISPGEALRHGFIAHGGVEKVVEGKARVVPAMMAAPARVR